MRYSRAVEICAWGAFFCSLGEIGFGVWGFLSGMIDTGVLAVTGGVVVLVAMVHLIRVLSR